MTHEGAPPQIQRQRQRLRPAGWMLVSLSSFLCFADDLAKIHGVVRTDNGVPIANTRVTARTASANTEHGAITDQRGVYRIQGIATGSWSLSTSGVETQCDVKSGQDLQCDIVVAGESPVANGGVIDS